MFILSIHLIGIVECNELEGELEEATETLIYHIDQEVDGSGFSSSYQDITCGMLHLGNRWHGSGSYSHESILTAYATIQYYYLPNETANEENISYDERTDFAYAPKNLQLGKSFKAGGFQSLGREETCIKNPELISMAALFDSTDALGKDLSANIFLKGYKTDSAGFSDKTLKVSTTLNVNAAFTGKAHFGALELNDNARNTKKLVDVHDTRKLVDEDYIGTFTIAKKMSSKYDAIMVTEEDAWQPCCFVGYLTMPTYYRTGGKGFGSNVKGIFDCTCWKQPGECATTSVQY
jgi:hypothetical protein